MLLIAENEVTNLEAYLRYFVPIAAKTIHAANGQYIADGEAKALTGQPLTRVVIVHFDSVDRLQQWWNSPERRKAWEIGAKYARFRDIAVTVDVPAIRLPLSIAPKEDRKEAHLFSHAETDLFFLEREKTGDKKTPSEETLKKFGLSKRESEVLAWVAQGKTNGEIAAILSLNIGTVKKHVEHIFEKLGVETRIAAAILALA